MKMTKMTPSEETYREMCSQEPMRGILAGLWKPKAGDQFLNQFNNRVRTVRESGSYVHDTLGQTWVIDYCSWLPREGDLMEMIKTQGVFQIGIVWDKHEFSVVLDKAEPEDYLWGDTSKEALLRAFGHTQELKWDGKWRREMRNSHHAVKSWIKQFRAVRDGIKRFEVRKNDRDYQVGDILILQEWNHEENYYTGYSLSCRITYILQGEFGLPEDVAVLQIEVL